MKQMRSRVLQACSVWLQAFQVELENQTVPLPIYSLWQYCHTCSPPKRQSEETRHSHAQESQWSLGLSYPHSEHRQRTGDLHWSWGSFCSFPRHLRVLDVLQFFTNLSNSRVLARDNLYMEKDNSFKEI